jgi:DNA-binding NarL/FixJ family response regulator
MTHGWAPSFMDAAGQTTLTIALVNDYNIVVMGNRAHSRVVPLLVKGFTRARPRRRARSDPRRRHRDQRATLRARSIGRLNWSGRSEGFTDRESEILALITQGRSNAEVAPLTHLVRTR